MEKGERTDKNVDVEAEWERRSFNTLPELHACLGYLWVWAYAAFVA